MSGTRWFWFCLCVTWTFLTMLSGKNWNTTSSNKVWYMLCVSKLHLIRWSLNWAHTFLFEYKQSQHGAKQCKVCRFRSFEALCAKKWKSKQNFDVRLKNYYNVKMIRFFTFFWVSFSLRISWTKLFFLRQLEHVFLNACPGQFGNFSHNYFYDIDRISKKY